LLPLHQHNEHEGAATVLGRLRDGQRIAYTSDAGTPALSDPGALLVRDVAAQGFRIVPVPGASSIASALSVAGDAAAQGFRFCGFAPAKGAARLRALTDACTDSAAQVWLEAPHRVAELAEVWSASANLRQVTVCRELTKQFETVVTLSAGDLPQWLAADVQRLRGEFVLVLHAAPAHDAAGAGDDSAGASDVQTLRTLDILLGELPLKQAVSLAARISGASRNTLYAQALQRKAE
jgi:16S rRNA (cytidine1402-2'-O)-methyltransferase